MDNILNTISQREKSIEIEKRLDREKISNCGTVFTETARFGDDCLRVCIYKNVDTDNEETIDITYNVFP